MERIQLTSRISPMQKSTHQSVPSPTLYPTREDALAWNDCLQDFFKADEDTTRSIQKSWPIDSNEDSKDAFQFVYDSIRQFLMAFWVAHTVRTQTDCTELLRVCAEKSDHLPITCYRLAHLLSRTDSPTHLQQFNTAKYLARCTILPSYRHPRVSSRRQKRRESIMEGNNALNGTDIVGKKKEKTITPGTACCCHHILSLTEQLPTLQNLEEIDLSHNAISDEAAPGLAQGLGSCQNLKKVDLSYNMLSDRGDFLPPLLNLEEIDLSHKNISDEAFLPQLPNLQELALCVSCQGEEEAELTDQLYRVQLPLRNLKLTLIIRDWSLAKMTRLLNLMLKQFPLLEAIDLIHSDISDEAVPGLCEALASSQTLEKLNLSHNKLSDVGELIEAFSNLHCLNHVDIYHNSIHDESLPTIAAWLNVNTAVKFVGLHDNRFSAEGVRDFVRTMKGKAYRWFSDDLLYDDSLADVGEAVKSGGEGARREEQQWERLRSWLVPIDVKARSDS
ncbi:positive regulation of MHC class I biosynthetic process [Branchiostoma belcheri]|nr:positive regulation of MHC class I biosynthetic process [Branchiostoma belcheri]